MAAFDACGGDAGGACDRMKTAVIGEDADRSVVYNPSLVALLNHYGSAPRACRAYRAKTKGKVERPFRYIRQDFFLDRTFRNLDDLNAQFCQCRSKIPQKCRSRIPQFLCVSGAIRFSRCGSPFWAGFVFSAGAAA